MFKTHTCIIDVEEEEEEEEEERQSSARVSRDKYMTIAFYPTAVKLFP